MLEDKENIKKHKTFDIKTKHTILKLKNSSLQFKEIKKEHLHHTTRTTEITIPSPVERLGV